MVGRAITINGNPYTVVGVLPVSFRFIPPFSETIDVWMPMGLEVDPADQGHNYAAIARLKPGVTLAQAQAEAASLLTPFRADYPKHLGEGERGLDLSSYQQYLARDTRRYLLVLLGVVGVVGLVLAIAAANVVNLLLGRAASRQNEMAVRLALGASGWRLIRQSATETLLITLLGGAAGLVVAPWGLDALVALAPKDFLPVVAGYGWLDLRVLGFALAVTLAVGLATGIIPALRVVRLNLGNTLKEGGRGVGREPRPRPLAAGLVAGEITLSTVLLAGALLLIVSLFDLLAVRPGFNPEQLWTFRMSLPAEKFKTITQAWNFEQQVSDRLRTLPGVSQVATASNLPLEWGFNFGIDVVDGGEKAHVYIMARAVSPGYFETMGIPVLLGRGFGDTDMAGSAPVVLVNQTLARRFAKGRDPLGALPCMVRARNQTD